MARLLTSCLAVAILIGSWADPARAVDVLSPGSVVEGKTIAEWGQDWWRWASSFPSQLPPFGDDPWTDTTGAAQTLGQSGPVFFMNAWASGVPLGTTRAFAVPAGVHILVPLYAVIYFRSAGEDPATLPGIVSNIVDQVTALSLEIDGVLTAQPPLFMHREVSGFFTLTVVSDNNFGEPPGTYTDNYADGYWVMLSPLAAGENVTIRVRATNTFFGRTTDISNQIRGSVTDLAVTSAKLPSKITLSESKPSVTKAVKLSIQNVGTEEVVVPDPSILEELVQLEIEPLGTMTCASPQTPFAPPKNGFPLSLGAGKKLSLSVLVTWDCASNDPLASTPEEDHSDFSARVTVDLSVLGPTDANPSNDECPRGPTGTDKGCGGKAGGALLTDIILK